MIPISQIDSELSIYKKNTVVIWGAGLYGKRIFDLLSSFQVKISAFCDMDEKKWGSIYEGIPVISPEELKNMAEKEAVTVQSGLSAQHEASALGKLTELGVKNKISFDECINILEFFKKTIFIEKFPQIKDYYNDAGSRKAKILTRKGSFYEYVMNQWDDLGVFISMVGKTADVALVDTLTKYNVPVYNTWHMPELFDKNPVNQSEKTVKVITAIRDPIAFKLSSFYEHIAGIRSFDVSFIQNLTRKDFLHGGNVQTLFEQFLIFNLDGINQNYFNEFFDRFSNSTLDLYQHSFDKGKGYSIFKENNIEVFVYQLEKLNDAIPALSQWVGVDFDHLEKSNIGSMKWTGEFYNRAQKELIIPEEYLQTCYQLPSVRHFYSESDIEKFKAKWKKNIDPTK